MLPVVGRVENLVGLESDGLMETYDDPENRIFYMLLDKIVPGFGTKNKLVLEDIHACNSPKFMSKVRVTFIHEDGFLVLV
jgi:hypothetical protein